MFQYLGHLNQALRAVMCVMCFCKWNSRPFYRKTYAYDTSKTEPKSFPNSISPLVKVIDTSISPFLASTYSPKRKGKIAYGLISKYRIIFEVKRSLELKREQEKENRKQIREEKKKEKELQKEVKVNRNGKGKEATKESRVATVPNKDKKPVCPRCAFEIDQHQVQCGECKKPFIGYVFPTTHQMHLPDDQDNDGFLCHYCYVKESEEAVDESLDDDVDELYNQYLRATKNLC